MKAVSILAAATACGFLAGCGSHAPAPIVYGTAPASTGRVYRSPTDYDRVNRSEPREERVIAVMPSAAPVLSDPLFGGEPSPSLRYADIEESELPPAPVYLSAPVLSAAASESGVIAVEPGDTVYAIARRTRTDPQAIIALNHLRPPYQLEIGQTIRLPQAKTRRAETQAAARAAEPAPDPSRNWRAVRPGDTLSSISRATGVPVKQLARANGLRAPYTLEVGDRLEIPAIKTERAAPKQQREARRDDRALKDLARNVNYDAQPKVGERLFEWPVKGAIIGQYGSGALGRRNDGVNIAAPVGTPVRAAADGEVVYRGSELDDYGNLLLIKHDDGFVTAYAHNDVMLVEKGQPVRQGQIIAKVGQSGAAGEPQLHFEIRQNLKAVDPIKLLEN
jgi:murein DD-endopeptidase MepM/ murein hydrolase activator NlpD